jgi:hypothetical protein
MLARRLVSALTAFCLTLLACAVGVSCRHGGPPTTFQEPILVHLPDGGIEHRLGDCHPSPGALGNSIRVGQYCTYKGDQCAENPRGMARDCALDYDSRAGNFCMRILCSKSSECGEGACCYGEPGSLGKACIPSGCVTDGGACPDEQS